MARFTSSALVAELRTRKWTDTHPWDRAFYEAYSGHVSAGMPGQEAAGVAWEETEASEGARPADIGYFQPEAPAAEPTRQPIPAAKPLPPVLDLRVRRYHVTLVGDDSAEPSRALSCILDLARLPGVVVEGEPAVPASREGRCPSEYPDALCIRHQGHDGRHSDGHEWWETDADGKVTAAGGPGRGGGLTILRPVMRPVPYASPADLDSPELAQTEVAEALEAAQPPPPTGAPPEVMRAAVDHAVSLGLERLAKAKAEEWVRLSGGDSGQFIVHLTGALIPALRMGSYSPRDWSPEDGLADHRMGLATILADFGREVLAQAPSRPQDAPAASPQVSPEAHEAALAQAGAEGREQGRAEGDAAGYRRGLDVARIQLEQMAHHQHNEAARARAEAECYDQTGDALAQAVAWVALELEQTEEPRS